MLTYDEIEAIREEIAGEPPTSPARRLLAHLDAEQEQENQKARKKMLQDFKHDGYTPEQAKALLEAFLAGKCTEFETVQCPSCDMFGRVTVPSCMGSTSERCRHCHGTKKITRLKMPIDTRFERV